MDPVAPSAAAWAHAAGGPGVLVLHGFTGNPTSMRPLAEHIAGHGYAVELPRLPGHGTSWRDLATTSWPDWLAEAGAGLDRLSGRPRAIVGLSMGATLALRLAQVRPADIAALVLINPSLTFDHPLKPALGLLRRIVPSLPGIGNDIARPGADELPYARVPLQAAASLFELQDIVRGHLHLVGAPTLVLTSRNDHTVKPSDSTLVVEGVGADQREQVLLERSFHVATLDYDADLIADRAVAWLAATVGTPGHDDRAQG